MKKIIFGVFLCFKVLSFCNAQTNIDHSFSLGCGVGHITFLTGRDDGDSKTVYPALLGGLLVNTVFHLSSRLFGADFAQTTFASIKTNLTEELVLRIGALLRRVNIVNEKKLK
jgi:hypothetical protein